MAIPISYAELAKNKPSIDQLTELIASFKTEPTFLSLAMWDLMISLFEEQPEKYKELQRFFIRNLVRREWREEVFRLAALDSEEPRPVFGRWQMLALMKRVLLESSNDGYNDPRHDGEAREKLGDACLMLNDLLFPEEQIKRLEKQEGPGERERIHDELMTQWFPQSELIYVPDVYQAVARNDEYLNIFDRRAEFRFSEGQTLGQRFRQLTGLEIRQYMRLYFALYTLHDQFRHGHPLEINANPGIINFDKERVFAALDFGSDEKRIFFNQAITDLASLIDGVQKDYDSGRAWQFDFTTFRNYPFVSIPENENGFTCIAFPFLVEKLASGIYHLILNSWQEDDTERGDFQSYWGNVFEEYVNDRLRDEYPPSLLANRFYRNPYFTKKRNRSIEVSDAVLDYGDCLVLIEHKGGYLSISEKYSDDVNKLLTGVAKKFGLDKAIVQLSRSIAMLFDKDSGRRDTFSDLDGTRKLFIRSATEMLKEFAEFTQFLSSKISL